MPIPRVPRFPRVPHVLRRQPALPGDVADLLGVTGEQLLTWSTLVGNGYAVATVDGLRALTPFGKVVRRPWTDVHHVAWDEDSGTLAVWWVGSRQPLPLELGTGSYLPEAVHERVRSSVVLTDQVPVPGRKPVWVALRKAPDGTLTTQAVAPPGVKLTEPEIADAVEAAQRRLRQEAGLA